MTLLLRDGVPVNESTSTPADYLSTSPSGIAAPSKLFWGDQDLTEQVDSNTLVLAAGTELYGITSIPTRMGLLFDGSTHYSYSGGDIGDYRGQTLMSMVALVRFTKPRTSVIQHIYSVAGANTNDSVENHQHSLIIEADGRLRYFHEDDNPSPGDNNIRYADVGITPGEYVLGFDLHTSGTAVDFFISGLLAGQSTGMEAPTGGSNSILRVGAGPGGVNPMENAVIGCLAFLFGDTWGEAGHAVIKDLLQPS